MITSPTLEERILNQAIGRRLQAIGLLDTLIDETYDKTEPEVVRIQINEEFHQAAVDEYGEDYLAICEKYGKGEVLLWIEKYILEYLEYFYDVLHDTHLRLDDPNDKDIPMFVNRYFTYPLIGRLNLHIHDLDDIIHVRLIDTTDGKNKTLDTLSQTIVTTSHNYHCNDDIETIRNITASVYTTVVGLLHTAYYGLGGRLKGLDGVSMDDIQFLSHHCAEYIKPCLEGLPENEYLSSGIRLCDMLAWAFSSPYHHHTSVSDDQA